MHPNIPELLVFFVYFSTLRCFFSDYRSYYKFCHCQEEMVFGKNIYFKELIAFLRLSFSVRGSVLVKITFVEITLRKKKWQRWSLNLQQTSKIIILILL